MSRLILHPEAKRLVFLMTDQLGRCRHPKRAAKAWRRLVRKHVKSRGFLLWDQCLFRLGSMASRWISTVVMDAIHKRFRKETQEVILPSEQEPLLHFLQNCSETGVSVNLNQLGEAVLGEEEAEKRLHALLQLLDREDVHYVSVKITAIFSQINLVALDQSQESIKRRLRVLYRAAMKRGKFVNLDMEEYCDLELMVQAFRDLLSEEEFLHFSAGIALQAYLPDSIRVQEELIEWSKQRCARGGAPIKIRLVKGRTWLWKKWNPKCMAGIWPPLEPSWKQMPVSKKCWRLPVSRNMQKRFTLEWEATTFSMWPWHSFYESRTMWNPL